MTPAGIGMDDDAVLTAPVATLSSDTASKCSLTYLMGRSPPGSSHVQRARLEENARREQMAPAGAATGPTHGRTVRGLRFAA
ncbi:Uncharacterised protein [Mycobacterium tuberculosis]|uniref:Uncharacterized protein n=1 Tax=Mycobacterium tuberculosis TaxID=1773 RepID=A0A0U0R9U1_MYCTX|nr:Uncharacterised protein [Mycobacterium tuberculosis]COV93270.1 Uncharacterised protein [Mycobacterium tuberculosis]